MAPRNLPAYSVIRWDVNADQPEQRSDESATYGSDVLIDRPDIGSDSFNFPEDDSMEDASVHDENESSESDIDIESLDSLGSEDELTQAQPAPASAYLADLSDGSDSDSDSDSELAMEDEASSYAPESTPHDPGNPTSPATLPSLSPSSSSSSRSADLEIIQGLASRDSLPMLSLALGLWCEKSNISREEYVRLRQIFSLVIIDQDNDEFNLPRKLDTLKKRLRQYLPMLQLMRKPIPVIIEKQPSFAMTDKSLGVIRKTSWLYWYNPINLVRFIIDAKKLTDKMYFGMAQYVDEPTELWHSQAWGGSIRSTSGDIARSFGGDLLIPGDIVRFEHLEEECSYGRITFIGRDYRESANKRGSVVVTLQPVLSWHELIPEIAEKVPEQDNELFLGEEMVLEMPPWQITAHVDVFLDWAFSDDDASSPGPSPVVNNTQLYIQKVVNYSFSQPFRPLQKSSPISGELEVRQYGREYLTRIVTSPNKEVLSLPFSLFIDDFGVHRNMYRAIKAFYWIPAALPYADRRKIANVFTLCLGPHGAAIEDIVKAIQKEFQELDRDYQEMTIFAYTLMLTGDMPQQAENSGLLRHTARLGCRSCYCPSETKEDLTYDVTVNGRYHFETEIKRLEIAGLGNKSAKERFTRETGVREQAPAIQALTPCLDMILSRTYDAPHSEWRGLGRILQGLLFSSILTKKGIKSYLKAFQSFPFPPNWPRIQSPGFYIWSWSLSEAGRASILTPLILRCYSKTSWYKIKYLEAAERHFNSEVRPLFASAINAIVSAYGVIAKGNAVICVQRHERRDMIQHWVMRSREAYQKLVRCADETQDKRTKSSSNDVASSHDILDQVIADDGRRRCHNTQAGQR
ncbi:MAG: hypothetical protein Q9208_008764 [Pyrenodesmia sp. 3 TL-2023]